MEEVFVYDTKDIFSNKPETGIYMTRDYLQTIVN